ncbi:hypothetical protein AVEN_194109-1 [Araneus ventricosus]|uniref:Uncharacterized protein n=1 Tax=Araneus ventricosus TaxID=182803 RepID=A0A4Y2SYI4_ARAVE|nr:hypothetical protein AVEN_194109-1 [Araneus ventricosus]
MSMESIHVTSHTHGNRKTRSSRPAVASGILNDSGRYDSSSTEAGVLVTHHRATVRPLQKEIRTITGGGGVVGLPIVGFPMHN